MTDGGTAHWVTGYYVGYQKDLYPPAVVNYSALTHLVIGRVVPTLTGGVDKTFDIDAINGPAWATDASQRARAAGKKVILMIGGAGEHAKWVSAASAQYRATFVTNMIATMNQFQADGLDLDWEPLDAADEPLLTALAQALRAASPGLLLTIPVGWVNANFPNPGTYYSAHAALFDQMNIMSYGMAGAWSGWNSWHSSALQGHGGSTPSSIVSSVNGYRNSGVPAAKLGIGIGFYGSCWSAPVTAPNQAPGASTIVADDNVMSYTNIMASYYSASARIWDANARVPYLTFSTPHGAQGCTFVSYEDPQSIAEKGAWVKANGLGGAIIWSINQGYLPAAPVGQRDPLMEAVKQAFLP